MILFSEIKWNKVHHSLRSKRFRGVSVQISMFWPCENWGEIKKSRGGRGIGEKETLAGKPLEFENRPLVLLRLCALIEV